MRGSKKARWWKLNDKDFREEFVQKARKELQGQQGLWEEASRTLKDTAKEVLGQTSGKPRKKEETRWWCAKVQEAITHKKLKKKERDMNRCNETIANYKKANKSAKRAVAKAKESVFKDMYDSLEEGQEGQQRAIRIAKQNNRESQDVY